MISKDEVKRIAKLARLELTEKEIEKMQKDLSSILDYFKLLKKTPKPKKEAEDSVKKYLNKTRKDEVKKSGLSDELFSAAPGKKENYVKVKAIL
ncbi:MAG: aspartyl-tRNA(Asn)/glutamyl-tRNA (Gln) amidotransferase subunit C [Parcubacteria group bacterium Licking1014_1]|nr:MAG: aspartyl-tRNA(Asn)/glutamyl-tRNA (Gln) amidotransferase subunit C [Parcubacteria group bacterium Licking1014_1]